MNGCETCTISKPIHKKIKAVEMCFWRMLLKISWAETKTDIEEAAQSRSLVNKIPKRWAAFIGNIMRSEDLEHLATKGKLERRRGRGIQMSE